MNNKKRENKDKGKTQKQKKCRDDVAPAGAWTLTFTGGCGYLHRSSWLYLSVTILMCLRTTSSCGGLWIFSKDQNSWYTIHGGTRCTV